MALENEKIVSANLFTVAGQSTTMLMVPLAGQSALGTLANTPNPLSANRLWDTFVAQWGASGNINGTCEIDLLGTIAGITGIPIARRITITTNNGITTIPSTTSSPSMPLPTHLNFIMSSAGTGFTGTISVVAKSTRKKAPFSAGAAQILEGVLDTTTVSFPLGVTNDVVRALGANNAAADTQLWRGFNKYTLWDQAHYYANVTGCSGALTIWIVGQLGGRTSIIAQSASISGATKCAIPNLNFGASLMPRHIIYDFQTTGDLAGITCQILAIAKSAAGRRTKI